jgi:uncharacterized protein (DUF342 family)
MPDDGITIDVAPDGMQASLLLPAGSSLPASATLDRMMQAGVIAGVVEEALRQAETPAPIERRLVVARGLPAEPPFDARVEVLVDFALRLEEDAEHRIDFHEQGRFHEVDAGNVLARLVPKRTGTPGRTVLGRDLPVGEPRDADLSAFAGEGTLISPDGTSILAARAGLVVKRRDGHIDIMPAVEVPGSLDMHWGNIITRLPVSIRGDIVAGFSLKSGADVSVKGEIEDARISVKGNLVCGGILPGKHRVKAHGDITARHVTGREVKCRNLKVASDVRGANVYAIGDVHSKVLVSTTVHCGGSLVCDELGSREEMGTVAQVGLNPLAIALWRLAVREHDAIAAEVASAKAECKRVALWVKQEPDDEKRQELAHRLKRLLTEYEHRLRRLGECEGIVGNATLRAGNNPDATVTVLQAVYPGVEIRIGAEARLVVAKQLGHTTFRLKDGRVVWE